MKVQGDGIRTEPFKKRIYKLKNSAVFTKQFGKNMKSRKDKLTPVMHGVWQIASSNHVSSQQTYYIDGAVFSLSFLLKLLRFPKPALTDKYPSLQSALDNL